MNVKFSLKQLRLFVAITQSGSLSRAAQQVALSQSAATMALKELELQLGQMVFDRVGKRLSLNSGGQWLLPRAQQVVNQSQEIALGFAGQQVISGLIKLGASNTVADHILPSLIGDILQQYPHVNPKISVSNSKTVIESLISHKIQLGLIESECLRSDLVVKQWRQDRLLLLVAASHPLAKKKNVSLNDLAKESWILRESGSGTRQLFDHACYGKLDHLNLRLETSHVNTLKVVTGRSHYVTCLSELVVANELASGELIALDVPALSLVRNLSLIWHKQFGDDPLRQAVINIALQGEVL